jgi:C1A family cysteine protease
LRLNQFADLTSDEFRLQVHGTKGSCFQWNRTSTSSSKLSLNETKLSDVPDSIDWTTKGVVTPVKDQGSCGSCWAFSATGSTECQYAIKHGELISLSEQQLVDCSHRYGNLGCYGGNMDQAFKYIIANEGLCSETEYPYTASGGSCTSSSCSTFYDPITSYTDVTSDDETSLVAAVADGCVSVAIEADQFAFQYYSSGILTSECGTELDHGVVIVGYGTDGDQEYWKVKNSWGTDWGEEGYVLICKNCGKNNNDGECGINMMPSYPVA